MYVGIGRYILLTEYSTANVLSHHKQKRPGIQPLSTRRHLTRDMTVRARKFDPKVLISAPRRNAGIPNLAGTYVLYSVSTYSFDDHESKSEMRLLDVKSNESIVIDKSGKCSEPVWLEGDTIAVLRSTESGATEVVVGNVKDFEKRQVPGGLVRSSTARCSERLTSHK